MQFHIEPQSLLGGIIDIPGDKSISHRSIIFGSIAEGTTTVNGFLQGEDSIATMKGFIQLGVDIQQQDETIIIKGVGLNGLRSSDAPLYMGNSGTSMRLLAGLLSGQSFDSTLTGDKSLTRRPMRRIAAPIALMGGQIDTTEKGTAPLNITGNKHLLGIEYALPMASAQVKSAILLAGLYAKGETAVIEPAISRDHTERMLRQFGYEVNIDANSSRVNLIGQGTLQGCEVNVPGDISSSAFFLVAASICPNSDVTLRNVGMNPTRIGIINLLQMMGADIAINYINDGTTGGEPTANLRVRSAALRGIKIPEDQVPLAIDEFPVLFIAAACAQGKTLLTGASELRHKESDRIAAMEEGLITLGVDAVATDDGIVINGKGLANNNDNTCFGGGIIESHHDHRIAMAFSVASLRASDTIKINSVDNVATSFPSFVGCCEQLGLSITTINE